MCERIEDSQSLKSFCWSAIRYLWLARLLKQRVRERKEENVFGNPLWKLTHSRGFILEWALALNAFSSRAWLFLTELSGEEGTAETWTRASSYAPCKLLKIFSYLLVLKFLGQFKFFSEKLSKNFGLFQTIAETRWKPKKYDRMKSGESQHYLLLYFWYFQRSNLGNQRISN